MFMNTTQAASLLQITEIELVRWLQGQEPLLYLGQKVDVEPPALQHRIGAGVKRKVDYEDLLRCQSELQEARLAIDLKQSAE